MTELIFGPGLFKVSTNLLPCQMTDIALLILVICLYRLAEQNLCRSHFSSKGDA